MIIDADIVIVRKNKNNIPIKLIIKATEDFQILFRDTIQHIANSEQWLIEIKDKNENKKILFSNEPQNQINNNYQYVRVESIMVNGFFTEYLSYNNKYLELIVY